MWTWTRLGSGCRRAPPELVDQPVRAERLVGVEQKQGQQGALLAPAERDHAALVEGLERAKDAEVHARGVRESNPRYRSPYAPAKRCCRAVAAPSPSCNHAPARWAPMSTPVQEAVMGNAIPAQHPSVVLRSHFQLVRALLVAATIAVVGLSVWVVILANDADQPSKTASSAESRSGTAASTRPPGSPSPSRSSRSTRSRAGSVPPATTAAPRRARGSSSRRRSRPRTPAAP